MTAYAFYTLAPETVAKYRTDRLAWTIPFVLYGIFRYLYLVHRKEQGGSPTDVLLTDRPLLVDVRLRDDPDGCFDALSRRDDPRTQKLLLEILNK